MQLHRRRATGATVKQKILFFEDQFLPLWLFLGQCILCRLPRLSTLSPSSPLSPRGWSTGWIWILDFGISNFGFLDFWIFEFLDFGHVCSAVSPWLECLLCRRARPGAPWIFSEFEVCFQAINLCCLCWRGGCMNCQYTQNGLDFYRWISGDMVLPLWTCWHKLLAVFFLLCHFFFLSWEGFFNVSSNQFWLEVHPAVMTMILLFLLPNDRGKKKKRLVSVSVNLISSL